MGRLSGCLGLLGGRRAHLTHALFGIGGCVAKLARRRLGLFEFLEELLFDLCGCIQSTPRGGCRVGPFDLHLVHAIGDGTLGFVLDVVDALLELISQAIGLLDDLALPLFELGLRLALELVHFTLGGLDPVSDGGLKLTHGTLDVTLECPRQPIFDVGERGLGDGILFEVFANVLGLGDQISKARLAHLLAVAVDEPVEDLLAKRLEPRREHIHQLIEQLQRIQRRLEHVLERIHRRLDPPHHVVERARGLGELEFMLSDDVVLINAPRLLEPVEHVGLERLILQPRLIGRQQLHLNASRLGLEVLDHPVELTLGLGERVAKHRLEALGQRQRGRVHLGHDVGAQLVDGFNGITRRGPQRVDLGDAAVDGADGVLTRDRPRINALAVARLELVQPALEVRLEFVDELVFELVEQLEADVLGPLDLFFDQLLTVRDELLDVGLRLRDQALDGRLAVEVEPREPLLGIHRRGLSEITDAVDQPHHVALDGRGHALKAGLGGADERLDAVFGVFVEGQARLFERIDDHLDAGHAVRDEPLALHVDQLVDLLADGLELFFELLALRHHRHGDLRPKRDAELDDLEGGHLGLQHQLLGLHLHDRLVAGRLRLEVRHDLLGLLLHLRLDLLDGFLTLLADVRDDAGVFFVAVVYEVALSLGVGLLTLQFEITRLALGLASHLVLRLGELKIEAVAHVLNGVVDPVARGAKATLDALAGAVEDFGGLGLDLVEGVLRERTHLLDQAVGRAHQQAARILQQTDPIGDQAVDGVGDEIDRFIETLLDIAQQVIGHLNGFVQRIVERGINLADHAIDGLGHPIGDPSQRGKELLKGGVDGLGGLRLELLDGALELLDGLLHQLGGDRLQFFYQVIDLALDRVKARLTFVYGGELLFHHFEGLIEQSGQLLGEFVDHPVQAAQLGAGLGQDLVFDPRHLLVETVDLVGGLLGQRLHLILDLLDERVFHLANARLDHVGNAFDLVKDGAHRIASGALDGWAHLP